MKKRILSIALAFSIVLSMAGAVTIGLNLSKSAITTGDQETTKGTTAEGKTWETVKDVLGGGFEEANVLQGNEREPEEAGWRFKNVADSGSNVRFSLADSLTDPKAINGKSLKVDGTKLSWGTEGKKYVPIPAAAEALQFKIRTNKDVSFNVAFWLKNDANYYEKNADVKAGEGITTVTVPLKDMKQGEKVLTDIANIASKTFQFRVFPNGGTDITYYLDDFKFVKEKVAKPSVIITATAEANGTVAPATQTVEDGSSVTLTATPNTGYVFEGWYKGGTKIAGAAATYTFNAAGAGAYVAKFKQGEKRWETVKDVLGGGFEEADVLQGNEREPEEAGWRFKNVADSGSNARFSLADSLTDPKAINGKSLKVDGTKLSWGTEGKKYVPIPAAAEALQFKIRTNKDISFNIAFWLKGDANYYQKNIDVKAGEDVTTVIVPLEDMLFGDKILTDIANIASKTFQFRIFPNGGENIVYYLDDFRFVKEKITQPNVTITATAEANGTVAPATQTVEDGSSVTLTATPNTGYVFEGWYKGGTKIAGASATYTFNAAGAGAYVAKFKEAEKITIKAVAGENGTVDKASQQVTEGTSVTIIATPNTGFFFDGWYKGETKVDGADATFTVNANANATYTAKFTATAPTPWLLNGRIPSGNFEADADIRGVNGDYDRPGWYVGYDTDAAHPRATVTLDTVAPIAGEKSLKVVGKDLNWCNQFKKGFSFAAKSDGFMFKIKTAKDMNFELSFYDKNDAKFYFKNLNVAGSNAVQTIRIPFKEFILERDTKSMADQDFLFTHKFQLRIIANAAGDASYALDDFIFIRKQPQQITITTSVEGGHGTASPATTTVEEGSNVTLSAVAEDGYEFEDWYLDGTKLGATSDTYIVKATKNANYVAKFKKSEAVDPKPEDDNQGFTEAFDPTKPGAVSKPGIGDITVDAGVQLNGKSSAKWDFDFTADKTGAQNFTDVTNANFSGDGFSMLVKTENDITVRVRLESDNPAPGYQIWTQKMYMTFEQEVKGSPDAQLISWSYSEAVRGEGLTNAVFAQLNHKNTALKMSLLPSKANPTAPLTGSFYFGAVDAINYNSMIKEEKPTEPTVERYMVKISADGKGKVTGGGEFDKDQLVQLGAEPNTKSYVFAGWFEGDKLISLDANYSFKAEKNITLVGKFVRKGSPEDPDISGGGDGDNSGNGDNNGDGSNNGGNGSNNGGNGSNGQPNTSDTTPIALLMTLILASGVLGTIVFVKRQKSK